VLTFDDAHWSIFDVAYPMMRTFGYVGTNYVHTGMIDQPNFLTLAQLHILEKEGWETGGHTVNHANLTQVDLETAEREIVGGWQYLRDHHLTHDTFALPAGHANEATMRIIKKYFSSIRNSEDLKMRCPIDPYGLGYYDARNTDGSEKIIGRILSGIAHHECIVIIGFHRILEDKDTFSRSVTPQEFREILEFLQDRDLQIMTISEAIETLEY
jgi:peptidoglycan/xylan/chitin deacetylase (PgdA/CDA1 family)